MEILAAYDQQGNLINTQERKKLLHTIQNHSLLHGDAPCAVSCINLLLINSKKEILLTKRGNTFDNPYMWDKTVGGHVTAGESFDETVIREAKEELNIKLQLCNTLHFREKIQKSDLRQVAIARLVDFFPWQKSIRKMQNGTKWTKRHRTAIYIGCYDGKWSFPDGESTALETVSLDIILQKLQTQTDQYTYDLQVLLPYVAPLLENLLQKSL